MTSIIIVPSKHLQAVFKVKVLTYLLLPWDERQLAAAAAGGDHNELSVPEGFKRVFQEMMRAFARSPMGLF